MKNFIKKYFLSLFILANFIVVPIFSTDFLITTSGLYALGVDIISYPTVGSNIIQISASNVVLDLADHVLFQDPSTIGISNQNGVEVSPGISNVTIKNGTIRGVTGAGVKVGAGCSNILVDNILTDSCFTNGINFVGTSTNPIVDSQISNCKILRCSNTATASTFDYSPLWLQYCQRTYVLNNTINLSGSLSQLPSFASTGCVELDNCNICLVENVKMYNNGVFGGVLLNNLPAGGDGTYGCVIRNCLYSGAGPGTLSLNFGGFTVARGSQNTFIDCMVTGCNIANANIGFFGTCPPSANSPAYNTFENCHVYDNFSPSTVGNTGFMVSADFITLKNCSVIGNSSGGGFTGFYINTGSNCFMSNCIAANNTSGGIGTCYGLRMVSGLRSEINGCEFSHNNGTTDALSFGISVDTATSTNNIFLKNISAANGPTNPILLNQNSGVPVGSFVAPGGSGLSLSLNEVTSVLANVSLID